MTIRSVLSKLLWIILRLWGVDTTMPLSRRDSSYPEFARAAAPRIHTRNGVRVFISHHGGWDSQPTDSMRRKGD